MQVVSHNMPPSKIMYVDHWREYIQWSLILSGKGVFELLATFVLKKFSVEPSFIWIEKVYCIMQNMAGGKTYVSQLHEFIAPLQSISCAKITRFITQYLKIIDAAWTDYDIRLVQSREYTWFSNKAWCTL